MLSKVSLALLCSFLVVLLLLAEGCAQKTENVQTLLVIQEPQYPAAIQSEQLQPGLSVYYFSEFYRNVSQMLSSEELIRKMGKSGPPITQLNHRFGDGKVFDSGEEKGVGMIMYGLFHLSIPGEYIFRANSNDGFELYINKNLIISDPGVHKDRLSDPGKITVAKGGWFPVEIKYFQRKGTATIELYWQPPGTKDFSIVPKEVYAHYPR